MTGGPAHGEMERGIIAWVEEHVGGAVERCERHARWRAGWWVDVRKGDGTLLPLYVRGAREEEHPPWPLEHEAGILQVLERHGIPAPHIHGVCQDPHAIVMDIVPGRHNLGTASNESERLSVLDHLARIMAAMHAIDPAEAVAIGVDMPGTPEQVALGCYEACDALYLRDKKRPDPRIEFLRRWVRKNVPQDRNRIALIHADAGQFLFEDGRITGMVDFEYGCLGDPLIDLAAVVMRAVYEPMGDLRPLFSRYAELTGEELSAEVICYHLVWWGLLTPMIAASDIARPAPTGTYCDYLAWYVASMLGSLEALADRMQIEIDSEIPQLESQPSRWAPLFGVIEARLDDNPSASDYSRQQSSTMVELARRMDANPMLEADYLGEAGRLVGKQLSNWEEADRELEAFVEVAGSEHEEDLVRLFYRWCKAQVALLDGLVYMPNFYQRIQSIRELVAHPA